MRSVAILALALTAAAAVSTPADAERPKYPVTPTVEHKDAYHGVEVVDPYRWLEQDVRESAEVKAWVEAQNAVTMPYLASIPEREAIERRLTELWNYPRYGAPDKRAGLYFYGRNDGLQNQSVIYVQQGLEGTPRVLVDPNTWSADGTVALAEMEVSEDGRYAAYGVQDGGSDWRTWRVLDVANGKLLEDELRWVKFSGVAWTKDGKGFFYGRYDEPRKGEAFQQLNLGQKVYYHRVGTPQSADELVYERPDNPEWGFGTTVTEDGRYLVLTIWKSSADKFMVYVKDLAAKDAAVEPVIDAFENDYSFFGNDGPVLYFRTDRDALRGRVIAIDLRDRTPAAWREIVPEDEATLVSASYIGGHFIARYLEDARAQVKVFTPAGKLVRDVELPGIGSVSGFQGRSDDAETFYVFSSFNAPPTIYRYDVATGKSTVFRRSEVKFDPADYVVEQVFYTSRDGTRVPMFLAYRKGIERNGNNPTLLYGYGGFNVPVTPTFSVGKLAWMEMGGVYAVANLRGGSEYGEQWHAAGTKLRKQNVFDDFIAAGEYLIAQKWTQPSRLAIQGGSNGGLLVGAVLNQRPDLFGAALPAVGVMDMLRFHKFTAGRFWTDDYGSSDHPEEFKALLAYSPYHNIKPGTRYPAVLVITADTDDRVVPGHSFKYAARLQQAQAGDAPVLIRIETRAGHGSGKPMSKLIEEVADEWAFLVENLNVTLPAGYAAPAAAAAAAAH